MTEAKEQNLSQHIMSAKDYVQDGLVFQLDGIENIGYGQHIEGVGVSYIDLKQGWGDTWQLHHQHTAWQKFNHRSQLCHKWHDTW